MTGREAETIMDPKDRRRAEDVYHAIKDEVFPRLNRIDEKIVVLDEGVRKLQMEGCPHRQGDLRRTESVEESMGRIFEKIDCFSEELTASRVDLVTQVGAIKTDLVLQVGGIKTEVTKQGGGIMVWVLSGVIVVLVGLLIYFAKDYAQDIETHVGKYPKAVTTTK